ncbi:uncharacterized protein F4822DRAFT_407420 [Hypoxylon trugodes]|uniref:uncharacterized protein n=1 Tax=Hypoxylon trugodes TaxID=326681 RepID=UPI0021A1CDF4|nr:uncharacterized protein F4822DRAFT_407420 [Hypoxylon trugodes]KAI1387724.1 hypothetical protein F4822DRAFT_407420 [Hypoxylon trugodes]
MLKQDLPLPGASIGGFLRNQAELDRPGPCSIPEYWAYGSSSVRSDEIDDGFHLYDWNLQDDDSFESEIDNDNDRNDELSELEEHIGSLSRSHSNISKSLLASSGNISRSRDLEISSLRSLSITNFHPLKNIRLDAYCEVCDAYYDNRRKTVGRFFQLNESSIPLKDRINDVRVFRSDSETGAIQEVFHFFQHSEGLLIDSPPILHPHKDLLAWPTAKGEVVFGDFKNRSYFKLRLPATDSKRCLVSIQGKYSACGRYIHLASLYGDLCHKIKSHKIRENHICDLLTPHERYKDHENLKGDDKNTTAIHFGLTVTTHRLSARTPIKTIPRLVYQQDFSFPHGIKRSNRGPFRPTLGYTLTWTEDYVFMAINDRALRIIRIPLFLSVQMRDSNWKTSSGVHENDGTVFLPESSLDRDVYYFPYEVLHKQKQTRQKTDAILFLSSNTRDYPESWPGGDSKGAKRASSPPQIVFLKQIGNWIPLDTRKLDMKVEMIGGRFGGTDVCKSCGRLYTDEEVQARKIKKNQGK